MSSGATRRAGIRKTRSYDGDNRSFGYLLAIAAFKLFALMRSPFPVGQNND